MRGGFPVWLLRYRFGLLGWLDRFELNRIFRSIKQVYFSGTVRSLNLDSLQRSD